MPGRITWAQLDAPTRSGGRVSWAQVEAPAVTVSTAKGRVSWAQVDAGIGLASKALGSVSVTASAAGAVSGAITVNTATSQTDRGKLSWARVDAPWPPPVQHDFNLDPGVSVSAAASASVAAGLVVVSDSSIALGNVDVIAQAQAFVAADLQIVVPAAPPPTTQVVGGGVGIEYGRSGSTTVRVVEVVDTETKARVADLARQVAEIQAQIATLAQPQMVAPVAIDPYSPFGPLAGLAPLTLPGAQPLLAQPATDDDALRRRLLLMVNE